VKVYQNKLTVYKRGETNALMVVLKGNYELAMGDCLSLVADSKNGLIESDWFGLDYLLRTENILWGASERLETLQITLSSKKSKP
jgi:hypothetical protein